MKERADGVVFGQHVEGRLKVIELQHLGHTIALKRIQVAQDEVTRLLLKIREEQGSLENRLKILTKTKATQRKPKTKVVASSTTPPRPSACDMLVELFGSDSSMD